MSRRRRENSQRRSLRRCRERLPGFGMYLRLWLYADLRCPRCGARGHWIDLPVLPRNVIRPKAEDDVRMSDYRGRPLRKAETEQVWRCEGCGSDTYSPEARAWTEGGGPYNVKPHETRVFTPSVSEGFAWEHDEDDECASGIDSIANPWPDVDELLDAGISIREITR